MKIVYLFKDDILNRAITLTKLTPEPESKVSYQTSNGIGQKFSFSKNKETPKSETVFNTSR